MPLHLGAGQADIAEQPLVEALKETALPVELAPAPQRRERRPEVTHEGSRAPTERSRGRVENRTVISHIHGIGSR